MSLGLAETSTDSSSNREKTDPALYLENVWTISSTAGNPLGLLISLTSVEPVRPATLKPRPSDCFCLIALLIHLANSDLPLIPLIPLS
ncbi:hypothetical protein GOODEAATRI_033287, partial [Goodea atripinnis]